MAVVEIRPAGTVAVGGWSPTGGTVTDVLADDSDATYIEQAFAAGEARVTLDNPTVPVGAKIVGVRAKVRVGSDGTSVFQAALRADGGTKWFTSSSVSGGPADVVFPWEARTPTGRDWTVARVDAAQLWLDAGLLAAEERVYEAAVEVEYNERPTVAVTGPAATVTDTTRPTVTFDYLDPEGDPQSGFRIEILHGSTVAWDSGWVNTGDTSRQVGTDLLNGVAYTARVQVRHRLPDGSLIYSLPATRGFELDLETPDPPRVYLTGHPAQGRMLVEMVDDGGGIAAGWFSVEHHDGDGQWVPLRAGSDLVPSTSGSALVWDHEVPFNRPRTYRVRAHAVVSGQQVASAPTDVTETLAGDGRWITDPRDPAGLNVKVHTRDLDRSWSGREVVHLPADLDYAVVESEPTVEQRQLAVWTLDLAEYETLVAALNTTRTLLYRDHRTSLYFRWVGDRTAVQLGPDVAGVDAVAGAMVATRRPPT